MRSAAPFALPVLLACAASDPGHDSSADSAAPDTAAHGGLEHDDDYDTDHSDELGEREPPFALVDINPNSTTFGQTFSSTELQGTPYGLIFLDSRCNTVEVVMDDVWALYQAHPGWWEAMPFFGVESIFATETLPESVEAVVDDNGTPYLQDTEEFGLWTGYEALNHDYFAVSEEGLLEAWLPLYGWPADLETLGAFLEARVGG